MSNVITSKLFTGRMDADALRELSDIGLRVADAVNVDDLDLPPVAYMEDVVGTVNQEEAVLLGTAYGLTEELDNLERRVAALGMQRYAEVINEAAKRLAEGKEPQEDKTEYGEAETMLEMYKLREKSDIAQKLFYFMVGTRLKLNDWRLGVRKGGKIVKLQRRW